MSPETVKNARYRVLRLIGRGRMSEVYVVGNALTNRQEALKVILADAFLSTHEAARFLDDEAKAIAALHHPHILPLLDYDEEVIDGSLLPYVVMPFCPDGSLSAWLHWYSNISTLSLQDVAGILRQIADALQYAHDHNIIHRDVKPSNMFICGGSTYSLPNLGLADFGIAKLTPETLSTGRVICGTPAYMAPEQWEGHPVLASDQYALAVFIYQLLTGCPLFQGDAEQLMYGHINVQPAPPSTINPFLSQGIDTTLLHALAKESGDRFSTVSAFAKAFEQVIQLVAVPAMVIPVTAHPQENAAQGDGIG